jgi:hypothetical protein
MKRFSLGLLALSCAVLITSISSPVKSQPSESATSTNDATLTSAVVAADDEGIDFPTDLIDAGFAPFFNLIDFKAAWLSSNTSEIIDSGMLLAMGEKQLNRKHKINGLTSNFVLAHAVKLALSNKDEECINRLKEIAATPDMAYLNEMMTQYSNLASSSRAFDAELTTALGELKPDAADYLETIDNRVTTAVSLDDKQTITNIIQEVGFCDLLTDTQRKAVSDYLTKTASQLSENLDNFELVELLSSDSRALPTLGSTRTKNVCYLSLKCGNTSSDGGSAVYQPDDGWTIVSYTPVVTSKYGQVSYSVNQLQANGSFASKEYVESKYKYAIEAAYSQGLSTYGGKIKGEENSVLSYISEYKSSHKAISINGKIKGEGALRGGASLQISVKVTEKYVGATVAKVNESVNVALTYIKNNGMVQYTLSNVSGKTVNVTMKPSGKAYTFANGYKGSFKSQMVNGVSPTLFVKETGKTYSIRTGNGVFSLGSDKKIAFTIK